MAHAKIHRLFVKYPYTQLHTYIHCYIFRVTYPYKCTFFDIFLCSSEVYTLLFAELFVCVSDAKSFVFSVLVSSVFTPNSLL